ncbi:MAG: hypothetical protein AABX82_04965, partial [Nanoarchaeota archaeon]
MWQKKLKRHLSSFFSFLALAFILLFVFSLQGTLTGKAVIVLDEGVTADQIAEIAGLASSGDETKMLSEVDLTQGGLLIFTNLNDGDTAAIKESGGNFYITGNVHDAVEVMQTENYKSLVEQYGILEIVNGEIVVEEEVVEEEVVQEEVVEEEVVEEEVVQEEAFSSKEKKGVTTYPFCKTTETGIEFNSGMLGASTTYTNRCDSNTEMRYVCTSDNSYNIIEQSCQQGCTRGKGCNEGYVLKADAYLSMEDTFVKEGVYCSITDAGNKVQGVDATGASYDYSDTCLSSTYLQNYYCTSSYDYSTKKYIVYAGSSNDVCENGCDYTTNTCRTERVDFGKASCTETATGVTGSDYVGRPYTYETGCEEKYIYNTEGELYIMAFQTLASCDEVTNEPKSQTKYCGDNQENMGLGYACGTDGSCIPADERPKVSNCFDSDEMNKDTFGTITVYDASGAATTFSDSCTTKNGK